MYSLRDTTAPEPFETPEENQHEVHVEIQQCLLQQYLHGAARAVCWGIKDENHGRRHTVFAP